MTKEKIKYHSTGRKGNTVNPLSKTLGDGEPLVIHVHMGGKKKKDIEKPGEDCDNEVEDMEEEK